MADYDIILFIAFVLSLAFTQCMYQRYQFRDLMYKRNLLWKRWRIAECVVICCGLFLQPELKAIALGANVYWLAFEIGTNLISLNKPVFFVGGSGGVDSLGKWKWAVIALSLITSILIYGTH